MTQTAELTATDDARGIDGPIFAASVSICGNTVVVGAYTFVNPGGPMIPAGETLPVLKNPNGVVYVFTEPATGWANMTQTAELTPSDVSPGGSIGMAVSISGNTVVAEGPGADYVFTEPSTGWANMTQTAKLTVSDGNPDDSIGMAVSISGNTVVGAGGNTVAVHGGEAAYVFTEPSAGWTNITQAARLTAKRTASDGAAYESFGDSVAISGNTMVVGAPDATVGASASQGAAYVFTRSGSDWVQVARLTASDGTANDDFGGSISISGDTIVVGASDATVAANIDQGAVYIFIEPASGWMNMTETAKLTAPDGGEYDWFGSSVSLSGKTLVVGSSGSFVNDNFGPGAAYVFTEPGSGWTSAAPIAKLTPSDKAASNEDDRFGDSVSISGITIVVGAEGQTIDGNEDQGEAYVFTEPASGWANMTQTATLTASDGAEMSFFGSSVSLSGNTVVVGAAADTVGTNAYQGAAYVFTEPAAGWANMTQTAKLTASDGVADQSFGNSVSISGNTVVAGSPYDSYDNGTYGQGAAYVFTEPGSGWANATQTTKLTASNDVVNDGVWSDCFGCSVMINGDSLAVGAGGLEAAYVFGTAAATPPVVTVVPSTEAVATVGQKYAFQVKTGASAGQKITFSLRAAPIGMSINASTGLITWVPNIFQTGSSTVTVLARDQFGDTAQQSFNITVSGVSTPFNPFASANRRLAAVGPVRGGSVAGAASSPKPASLSNAVVGQLFATNGVDSQ